MSKLNSPLYYADYLQLDKLLHIQNLRSGEAGSPAHDEHLFIIVHQVYELWFKQVLYELDAVLAAFNREQVDEKQVGVATLRLGRITEIQKLLIDQLRVLETMTALDFLEFRDVLYPASGFQSYQFRLIENKLGMQPDQRLLYNKEAYYAHLEKPHQVMVKQSEGLPSLFDVVERWLGRTPFLEFEGFNFWEHYRSAVDEMLESDRRAILSNIVSTEAEKQQQLEEVKVNEQSFAALLDPEKHKELVASRKRRMSREATEAALLIMLYRDEPILHLPFRLLTVLMDMDEHWTTWRYRHALMAHRMIGNKIGTGGSTGYNYLKATVDRYKVYGDLFNLSTFLIPRSRLPELPEGLRKNLGFYYSQR